MKHWKETFMRCTYRSANREKVLALAVLITLLGVSWVVWPPSPRLNAHPQTSLQAVTDRTTYNVDSEVRLQVLPPESQELTSAPLDVVAFVRYAGEDQPVNKEGTTILSNVSLPGEASAADYRTLWKIPTDALPGRYEIDLVARDSKTHAEILSTPRATSFAVHRKLVEIDRIQLNKAFYAPGDAVGCRVSIRNLTDHRLEGLRVEFSDRYWPWIAGPAELAAASIVTLTDRLSLLPEGETQLSSERAAVAKAVSRPAIHQYGVVVWDRDRKNVYDIAFSPLVFINPPGVDAPRPYPGQYIYPRLDAVNTSSYRHFHPGQFGSGAIQFDTGHTMFPSGAEVTVKFWIVNPTDTTWRRVSVRARLVGPNEKELAKQVVAEQVDLNPHSAPLVKESEFSIPQDASGLYQVRVEVTEASGRELASNALELAVNPLPKSLLLFCAHEDDEGTQMGFIRALVENHLSVRVVYLTSGDAGSCDRYYEHSCGPAEALNFGALRMEEARAALGHLGVSREDILFLGLPDGGSGKIWYDHTRSSDPYLSVLLASDRAPYEGLFRPNLPFAREAVVEAVEEIIKKFQPEVVFTSHPPAEGHIDHILNNYFVVKALQQLLREGAISPNIEVRVDRIFDPKSYPATPYHYEDHTFHVSGEAMALAQEAGWYYQSQGGNRAEGNLRTWDQLPRSEGYRKMLDWKGHEGWNEKE
jgi:LmbE family N-acetylglucosaminyl deacetylase